ncbi:hypothetical protein [Richelia intracellularis]
MLDYKGLEYCKYEIFLVFDSWKYYELLGYKFFF